LELAARVWLRVARVWLELAARVWLGVEEAWLGLMVALALALLVLVGERVDRDVLPRKHVRVSVFRAYKIA
jgi:hypothetical protein